MLDERDGEEDGRRGSGEYVVIIYGVNSVKSEGRYQHLGIPTNYVVYSVLITF